jgi:type IV secretion system protein VirD4
MIKTLLFLFQSHKKGMKFCVIVGILVSFYLTGTLTSFGNLEHFGREPSLLEKIGGAFSHPFLFLLIFAGYLFVCVTVFKSLYGEDPRDGRILTDTGEHGSSREMTKEEADAFFLKKNIHDPACRSDIVGWANRPLGQVYLLDEEKHHLNGHTMVCAKSGAGKSTSYVFPKLAQIMKRGESFVVTDTSGETPEQFAKMAEEEGYETRIINFLDPEHSDGINPLTMFDYGGDPVLIAQSLAALISANCADDSVNYFSQYTQSFLSFLLVYVAQPWADPKDGGCGNDANNRNLPALFDLALEPVDSLRKKLEAMDVSNPARIAAASWAGTDQKHQEQPKQTVQSWMAPLMAPSIKAMLSHNDTDLRAPGLRKCAYFVCVPSGQQGAACNWIAALIYGAMIECLQDLAYQQVGQALPVTVNLIFDEFPNIFKIPGWGGTLNNIRKNHIHATMIFQGIQDLERAYPRAEKSLINACDLMVFLGTNDRMTAEYFEKRSGEATAETSRRGYTAYGLVKSPEGAISTTGTYTYTADMLMKLNEHQTHDAIIYVSQQNAIRLPTVYYKDLPMAEKIVICPPKDHVPMWKKRRGTIQLPKEKEETEKKEKPKPQASPFERHRSGLGGF